MRALLMLVLLAAPYGALAQGVPSDFTYATRYDAARRITGTIAPDPDGGGSLHHLAVRNGYDAGGRLVTVEKGELVAWQAETVAPADWAGFSVQTRVDTSYDALDRKVLETVSSGGTAYAQTQWSYDGFGRLECTAVRMNPAVYGAPPASACALGSEGGYGQDRITRNGYDAAGQLLVVTKAYGTAVQADEARYTYSGNGQRTSVTDANGNRAGLSYDGFDRLARWSFPSPASAGQVSASDYEAYGYDAAGNRTSLRKRDGRTLTFSYDALNRVTGKVVPDGCAPIQQGACAPASATRDVYYGYDLRGLQTYARFDSASGEGIATAYDGFGAVVSSTSTLDGTSRTVSYQYDAGGNRMWVTHPDGTAFYYQYEGLDRPTIVAQSNGVAVANHGYDAAGRSAGVAKVNGASYWSYDAIGRVSGEVIAHANGVTYGFGYNPAGQVTTQTRDNDAYAWTGSVNVDRGYAVNGLNQYTSAGSAVFGYDANGNLISDGTNGYGYDAENRLVMGPGGTALTYDPLGRLWQVAGGNGTTQFAYDGDRLVAEYGILGQVLRRYVHDAGADEPLIWYEGAGLGTLRLLQRDRQGSVVQVSDANNLTVAINAYDEYGIPGAGNAGRFGYTGQAWLPELGMWYYKARMYSPTLGRFLQTDPIGYADQINLYAYVANDPVNGRDPSGLLDDRTVQFDPVTKTTTLTIPVIVTGSGSNAGSLPAIQGVASQLHSPSGENGIRVVVTAAKNSRGDTQTVDLSPGKDNVHYNNGQGEGNNIRSRSIHIDSSRADSAAASMHDLLHGGRGRTEGATDRYSITSRDSAGQSTASSPQVGYENNIMGTTTGRELNNSQIQNEIQPRSKVIP